MPSTSSYSVGATPRLRMELAEKLLEVAIEEAREPNVINGIPDVNDMAPAQLVVHTAEVMSLTSGMPLITFGSRASSIATSRSFSANSILRRRVAPTE